MVLCNGIQLDPVRASHNWLEPIMTGFLWLELVCLGGGFTIWYSFVAWVYITVGPTGPIENYRFNTAFVA